MASIAAVSHLPRGTATSNVTVPIPKLVPSGSMHTMPVTLPDVAPTEGARELSSDIDNGDDEMRLGQYDKAIIAYEAASALSPRDQQIERKIERARRAKSAEEQILGASSSAP